MSIPATKLSQIKNLAEAIERALGAQFLAFGGRPTIPRESTDLEDLWCNPSFAEGGASNHRFKRPDGNYDYDLFPDSVITFDIVSPRLQSVEYTPAMNFATWTLIGQEIVRVKLALDVAQWPAINARLDYHHLTELVPLGAHYGFDAARGEDVGSIRFRCTAGVKNGAWPTDPAAYAVPV